MSRLAEGPDDSILCIVNRAWDNMDKKVKGLIKRIESLEETNNCVWHDPKIEDFENRISSLEINRGDIHILIEAVNDLRPRTETLELKHLAVTDDLRETEAMLLNEIEHLRGTVNSHATHSFAHTPEQEPKPKLHTCGECRHPWRKDDIKATKFKMLCMRKNLMEEEWILSSNTTCGEFQLREELCQKKET